MLHRDRKRGNGQQDRHHEDQLQQRKTVTLIHVTVDIRTNANVFLVPEPAGASILAVLGFAFAATRRRKK